MPEDHPPAARPPQGAPILSETAALAQLRAFIADRGHHPGDRLPPERVLCTELGLRRSELRKALDALQRAGEVWRHVGKGTFLTAQDDPVPGGRLAELGQQVSPADVMRARAVLEPALAREAALHASAAAIAKMRLNAERARMAATWREYEALDNDFHRLIAEASGSVTLLALFDQLNALRRAVSWGSIVRSGPRPPPEHDSFAQHERILEGIALRDHEAAQGAMRAHLRSVQNRLFG